VQLTSDGHSAHPAAVKDVGPDVDYAQLRRMYGPDPAAGAARRYCPPVCIGAEVKRVWGSPGAYQHQHSRAVEPDLRMAMRRFTRLTNGF
jgi:hypothetical protein